jgi:hypothetical protein
VNIERLKALCAERGLLVVGVTDRIGTGTAGVIVKARSDNRRLSNLPTGLRICPAGSALTIIEIEED